MMWEDASTPSYGALMRNSMATAAELLESIERDIQESRQIIYSKNAEESSLAQLVTHLTEDNEVLKARLEELESELTAHHDHSARTNDELFAEFEEKILACNGEIERVVTQCNEANNEKEYFQSELKKMEEICAGFSEELSQAKLVMQSKAFQIQRMQLENEQLKGELARTKDALDATKDLQQTTQSRLDQLLIERARAGNSGMVSEDAMRWEKPAGSNLYADEDIAELLRRVRALEDENQALSKAAAQASSPQSITGGEVTHRVPLPAAVSTSRSGDDGNAPRYVFAAPAAGHAASPGTPPASPSRITSASPGREGVSARLAQLAALRAEQEQGAVPNIPSSPVSLTARMPQPATTHIPIHPSVSPILRTARPSFVADPRDTWSDSHQAGHTLPPSSTVVFAPHATEVYVPAHSQRQFESPESDEGAPFELDEDYVPPSSRPSVSFSTTAMAPQYQPARVDGPLREESPVDDPDYGYPGGSSAPEVSTPYASRSNPRNQGGGQGATQQREAGARYREYGSEQSEWDDRREQHHHQFTRAASAEERARDSVQAVHVEEDEEVEEVPRTALPRVSVSASVEYTHPAPRGSAAWNELAIGSSPVRQSQELSYDRDHYTGHSAAQQDRDYLSDPEGCESIPTEEGATNAGTDDENFALDGADLGDTEYADDFETGSYDDRIGRYARDEQSAGARYYESGDYQEYQEDGSRDGESQESGNRGDGSDAGSDVDREEGSEEGSAGEGLDNVFMYDGSAAGERILPVMDYNSTMILDFDPSIGLDELSRLSL